MISRKSTAGVWQVPGLRILFRSAGIIVFLLVIAVAFSGLEDGFVSHAWSTSGTLCLEDLDVVFIETFTNDDGTVDDPAEDPGDNGIDPGYDKDVAYCEATIEDDATVVVDVDNAFPSYTCRFWAKIRNIGDSTLRRAAPVITAPAELTVTEIDPQTCGTLKPGAWEMESFTVHIEQPAQEGGAYHFEIAKTFMKANGGTIGFWKNWDSHNTFTQSEIEGWLDLIDADSDWLHVQTIAEMEAVFKAATKNTTPGKRFLAQYLATRLNSLSGILCAGDLYDISGIKHYAYLGLDDPHSAALGEIIDAIEAKYGTSPTKWQFEVMKDLCDEINNLLL